MRNLNRNKRELHYALLVEEKPIYDEYGNETSETELVYGEPVKAAYNVSASVGEDAVSAFGSFTNYSRTVSVADTTCPMDETSVVWFGITPEEPYNYIVTKKADSKNGLFYALQEIP